VPLPKRLRLPLVLTSVVLGTASAIVACTPEEENGFFCVSDLPAVDAGPTSPDATPCGQIVGNANDCPPGCEPESLG
jgi:hypothetical protein